MLIFPNRIDFTGRILLLVIPLFLPAHPYLRPCRRLSPIHHSCNLNQVLLAQSTFSYAYVTFTRPIHLQLSRASFLRCWLWPSGVKVLLVETAEGVWVQEAQKRLMELRQREAVRQVIFIWMEKKAYLGMELRMRTARLIRQTWAILYFNIIIYHAIKGSALYTSAV